MTTTYSNKSNARRAAKAAGYMDGFYSLILGSDERWHVIPVVIAAVMRAEPVSLPVKPLLLLAAPKPVAAPAPKAAGALTHKEFSVYGRSAVLSPIQFVKKFLDENGAGLSRKEALYQLAQAGVNYATARTQYQRWFSNNKK